MMLNKYININLFINRKSYCKQNKIKFPKVSNSKSLLQLTRSSCPIHIYDPQIDGYECACSALALLKILWYYSINDIYTLVSYRIFINSVMAHWRNMDS